MYQVGDLEIESPVHIEKRFGRGLVEQPAERHHRAGRAGAATLPRGAACHTQSDLHSLSCLVQHTHTISQSVKKNERCAEEWRHRRTEQEREGVWLAGGWNGGQWSLHTFPMRQRDRPKVGVHSS